MEILMLFVIDIFKVDDLDSLVRFKFYVDYLVYYVCLKNEFYEYKVSVIKLSELGCMMENLGCVGI